MSSNDPAIPSYPFENPLKRERLLRSLTLEALALKTGVSRMTIIRTEQGLYNVPSDRLLTFLSPDSAVRRTGLQAEYQVWRKGRREASYGVLPDAGGFNAIEAHPFVAWRESAALNQNQVAKAFCIHRATLYKFESQPHLLNDVPEDILEALIQSGYSTVTLQALRSAFSSYKTQVANHVLNRSSTTAAAS